MTDIDSKESAEWKEPTIESLRQQLAESQALVNVLWANLAWYVQEDDVIESMPGNEYWVDGLNKAREALALPTDFTALDEALAKAKLKGKREALLEAAEHFYNSSWIEMNGKKRISKDSLVKYLRRMADGMK